MSNQIARSHTIMFILRDYRQHTTFCARPIGCIAQNPGRPGTAPNARPGIAVCLHTPHGFPGLGARYVYTLRAAKTLFLSSRALIQGSMSRTRNQNSHPLPPKVRSTDTKTDIVLAVLDACAARVAATTLKYIYICIK